MRKKKVTVDTTQLELDYENSKENLVAAVKDFTEKRDALKKNFPRKKAKELDKDTEKLIKGLKRLVGHYANRNLSGDFREAYMRLYERMGIGVGYSPVVMNDAPDRKTHLQQCAEDGRLDDAFLTIRVMLLEDRSPAAEAALN